MRKYLFFDIECANCFNGSGKICEFGYVLTDESFNVIEKEQLLVNPRAPFDRYVLKKMLAYTARDYRSAPDYKIVYKMIAPLFNDPDIMIFGHTLDSDFTYLNDEAKRFSLPYFDCEFFDARYMYVTYKGGIAAGDKTSVAAICDDLGADRPEHEHRALDDAYSTMLIVRELCRAQGAGARELVERSPDCRGFTRGGMVSTPAREHALLRRIKADNALRGKNRLRFARYLKMIETVKARRSCELSGKTVCISERYERDHYREMLKIAKLLKECGCTYSDLPQECDCFVKCGDDDNGERYKAVRAAMENGQTIAVFDFDAFLAMLELDVVTLEHSVDPRVFRVDIALPKKRAVRRRKRGGRRKRVDEATAATAATAPSTGASGEDQSRDGRI